MLNRRHEGKRVMLVKTGDAYTRLARGSLGTAVFEDDVGTLHVDWDDGSTLGLLPSEDSWDFLSPEQEIDVLADKIKDIPRGQSAKIAGANIARIELPDRDGWEFSIDSPDVSAAVITAHEAASEIVRQRG